MSSSDSEFRKILDFANISSDNFNASERREWSTPDDLGRMSIEAMGRSVLGTERYLESFGLIHLKGTGVIGHSANLDSVGNTMTLVQRMATSIGASLSGIVTLRGKLPLSLIDRTQLKLSASPQPGSLLLLITPQKHGFDELHPNGPALFEIEGDEGEGSPLADAVMSELVELLSLVDINNIDPFLSSLEQLGPRAASSVRELLKHLSSSHFDTGIEWSEPSKSTKRVRVSQSASEYAWRMISDRSLDSVEEVFTGQVITISLNKKLELLTTIDGEESVISIKRGGLSDSDIAGISPTNTIKIHVRSTPIVSPGGEETNKYEALHVERVSP